MIPVQLQILSSNPSSNIYRKSKMIIHLTSLSVCMSVRSYHFDVIHLKLKVLLRFFLYKLTLFCCPREAELSSTVIFCCFNAFLAAAWEVVEQL